MSSNGRPPELDMDSAQAEVIENEQAALNAFNALVAEGVLVEIDVAPLCRYEAHRSSDWRAGGGGLVCGICHPPAKGGVE